jgi:hypothetical protein
MAAPVPMPAVYPDPMMSGPIAFPDPPVWTAPAAGGIEKQSVPFWQRAVALAGLAIAAIAVVVWLAGPKPWPGYAKEMVLTRGPNGKFDISAEDLLGLRAPLYADYVNDGKGQVFNFQPVEGGRNKEDFVFELEPTATGDPQAGPRKEQIEKAKAALAAKISFLNSLQQRFLVVLDYTDGVDERLKGQLANRLSADRIQEMGKMGYEVGIFFHKVTESPSYNVMGPVIIPPGSAKGAGQEQLDVMRETLLRSAKEERYSAIGTGIFNFLHEDGLHPGDHVLVFSDGIENDPNTISFEPSHPRSNKWSDPLVLSDKENLAEVEARLLQATPTVPDLKGVVFDWYLPPASPERLRLMTAAILIWKDLLEKHGAEFHWHL